MDYFVRLNMWPLILTSLLLTACAYSVERLSRDDDLRHKVLKSCVAKGLEAKDDQNCINAAKAQSKVTGKAIKGLFE